MIDINSSNKISEIRHMRIYTSDRYGHGMGLKDAKVYIDSVEAAQIAARSLALDNQKLKDELRTKLVEVRATFAGRLSHTDIRSAIDSLYN